MIETKSRKSIKELYRTKCDHKFNTLIYGKIFKDPASIIAGGTDGIIRIYPYAKDTKSGSNKLECTKTLESKGGPVFHIASHDVTRLSSNDIIITDSIGGITLFCNGQIFLRKTSEVPTFISTLQVYTNATGNINIITGSDDGTIQCFNAFKNLWKVRLCDINSDKTVSSTNSVTAILATQISSSSSPDAALDYIVVADSERNLHFIRDGNVLASISTPAVVNSIVAGQFVTWEDLQDNQLTQLALGCSNGIIWICADFKIQSDSSYVDIKYPITKLHGIEDKQLENGFGKRLSSHPSKVDMLLCAGHFAMVFLLHQGIIISKISVPDWVISISSISNQEEAETDSDVLIGCLDASISVLRIQ